MTRARTLLAIVAPLLAACAPAIHTSGALRTERVQSSLAAASTALRVAPVIAITDGSRTPAAVVEIAPQSTTDGAGGSTTRVRVAARWTGRAPLRLALGGSVEEGYTRASEFAGDTLSPGPAVAVLRARSLRVGGSLRWQRGRRAALDARLAVDQSAGLGASADALPRLASTGVESRLTWNATRRLVLVTTARAAREQTGEAAALLLTRAATAARWQPLQALGLSASAGLVASGGSAQRTIELGFSAGRPTGPRVALTHARGPEVDRLDGTLLDRSRTRVRFETPLVQRVSFGGTLQNAGDLGGALQRHVSSADAGFSVDAGRGKRAEFSVARFRQYSGGMMTNAETRAVIQFTFFPTR